MMWVVYLGIHVLFRVSENLQQLQTDKVNPQLVASYKPQLLLVHTRVQLRLGWHHRGDLQLALLAARLQPALMTFAGERIREKVMYIIKKELPLGSRRAWY